MRKAHRIGGGISATGADQGVYRLEPGGPLPEFVLVSGVNAFGLGPETYIFQCDEGGHVRDWCELDGSYKGSISHETALRIAGYEIAELAEIEVVK